MWEVFYQNQFQQLSNNCSLGKSFCDCHQWQSILISLIMAFLSSKMTANYNEKGNEYLLLFRLYNRLYTEAQKERYSQDV